MHTECAINAQSSSGKCASYAHDTLLAFVHDPHMDIEWFKAVKKEAGVTDAQLAEALGVERSVANKVVNGKVAMNARRVDAVAELLGVPRDVLMFRAGISTVEPRQPDPDLPRMHSVDSGETAFVSRLDMRYAMGDGTDIDANYIEEEPVALDMALLRRLTPSPPHRLRIVSGIGDSMQPTIHESEELILDLNQHVLNMHDRIWALSLFGSGALKRLRAVSKDRVLVISDNPGVPDQEVSVRDIRIIGRLVGSIKRH